MALDIDKALHSKKTRRRLLEQSGDDNPQLTDLRRDIYVLEAARLILLSSAQRKSPRRGIVSDASHVGIARTILDEAKAPLHIDEIVAQMKTRGYRTNKSALTSRLSKMVRDGQIFKRVDAATFALIGWRIESRPAQRRVGNGDWGGAEREGRNFRLLKQNRRP